MPKVASGASGELKFGLQELIFNLVELPGVFFYLRELLGAVLTAFWSN